MSVIVMGAILYPLTTKGDASEAQRYFSTPLNVLSVNQSEQAIKGALVYISQEYGLNEKIVMSVIQCESRYDAQASGGDSGLAYGIAQFHKATFDEYCTGSYYSPADQLNCLGKMWQMRQQKQWGCWDRLFGK